MSNHDWETMALILVGILTTKPLTYIYKNVGGQAGRRWVGGHVQGSDKLNDFSAKGILILIAALF
jgi:hypothetical protein